MQGLATPLRSLIELLGFVPPLPLMITGGLETEYRMPIVFFSIKASLHLTRPPNAL